MNWIQVTLQHLLELGLQAGVWLGIAMGAQEPGTTAIESEPDATAEERAAVEPTRDPNAGETVAFGAHGAIAGILAGPPAQVPQVPVQAPSAGEQQANSEQEGFDPLRPRSLIETGDGKEDGSLGLALIPPRVGSSFTSSGSTVIVTAMGPNTGNGKLANKQPRWYVVTLPSTGTGFVETFLVQVPTQPRTSPAPMLVVFHKYGSGHMDVLNNTTFRDEVVARGWYLVAPLGASTKHFSSHQSQINTEAVLDWTLAHFNVDRQRIYGVGFSMGGGAALNYAARHLDPERAMFAALFDHSGSVSLPHVYEFDIGARVFLDYWYGDGTPASADAWKMARSSVVVFDPITLAVDLDKDLGRNLLHTAIKITRASDDTVAYLSTQSDVLDSYFQSRGLVPGPTYGYEIVTFTGHSWSLLDETAVCDWFAQQVLQIPTQGDTLADRGGRYFHLDVVQETANVFTPFTWSFDAANNQFSLSSTKNFARVAFDPVDAGLDPALALNLSLATADGLPDEVRVLNYPFWPVSVTRDGVLESSWSYDPGTLELSLVEYDGAATHDWQIQP